MPSTPGPSAPRPEPCPVCGGLGWVSTDVPVGHPRFGKLDPCACLAAQHRRLLQELSGLTEDVRAVRLTDIVITRGTPGTRMMVEAARDFVERPRGILTIWGTHGNAKSLVLRAIVNEAIWRGLSAVYIRFFDLVEWMQEAYKERDNTGEYGTFWRRFQRLVEVPVLAIDEFEKITETEARQSLRVNLFDHRYQRGLAGGGFGTVIAMNANPEYLDPAILSRMRDGRNTFGGHGPILRNDDPDMRSKLK